MTGFSAKHKQYFYLCNIVSVVVAALTLAVSVRLVSAAHLVRSFIRQPAQTYRAAVTATVTTPLEQVRATLCDVTVNR